MMIQKNGGTDIMMYIGKIGTNNDTCFGGASTNNSDNTSFTSLSNISGSDWTTLTFTSDGSNFKLYVNGALVNTIALETTKTALTGFQFGTTLANGGHDATTLNFDNIAFWNTALTATQVASLIPEPSMFGFFAGTLALGLAGTRRRRR